MRRWKGKYKVDVDEQARVKAHFETEYPFALVEVTDTHVKASMANDSCVLCGNVVEHGKDSEGYATHICQHLACSFDNFLIVWQELNGLA